MAVHAVQPRRAVHIVHDLQLAAPRPGFREHREQRLCVYRDACTAPRANARRQSRSLLLRARGRDGEGEAPPRTFAYTPKKFPDTQKRTSSDKAEENADDDDENYYQEDYEDGWYDEHYEDWYDEGDYYKDEEWFDAKEYANWYYDEEDGNG